MVGSQAKLRAAAQAASLLLLMPLAAQTAGERMPLPVPRPDWIDALVSASAHHEAQTAPVDEPRAQIAATPERVPLPIPRPKFLDQLPTDNEGGVTRVSRSTAPRDNARTSENSASPLHSMIGDYARHHGVPERLAHRIVQQESRYNPVSRTKVHFGLMQVSLPTAKSMGYVGDVIGLLDAKTNLTYSMPYLANAWIVSGGDEEKARRLYMTGYHQEAKRKGLLNALRKADSPSTTDERTADAR